MSKAEEFIIKIDKEVLKDVKKRVKSYPWHEMPDDGGWEYGTNLNYMKNFCSYWVDEYDWREQEKELNKQNNFIANIDGMNIHFIHEKGSGPDPQPLLLCHGWPGSIFEFIRIIEPLAHPERFGGDSRDAFDVIVPSLPGFGFSDRPPRPFGPKKMSKIMNSLMTDILDYGNYFAQGGDWGAAICSWLGFEYPTYCKAIHINFLTMRHPKGPKGPEEKEWAKKIEIDQIMENGYRTQQATKPQTLSYAMMDSPVGIAAWLIEKFNTWSDVKDNNIEEVHSKDSLLTNIMIYIVTRSFNSASWIYYGRREEGGRVFSHEGNRVEVPTGCALFPAEMLAWPPRSYVEKLYNVIHWSEMDRGGHFAALEQPDLLIKDIQTFAKRVR